MILNRSNKKSEENIPSKTKEQGEKREKSMHDKSCSVPLREVEKSSSFNHLVGKNSSIAHIMQRKAPEK